MDWAFYKMSNFIRFLQKVVVPLCCNINTKDIMLKVGVKRDGSISNELINETKIAIEVIAKKYNCQFVLTTVDDGFMANFKGDNRLKSAFNKKTSDENGTFLSFGGELEIE